MNLSKVMAAVFAAAVSLGANQIFSGSAETTSFAAAFDLKTAEKYTLGDVNGDGIIDADDASLVLTEYSCQSSGKPSIFKSEQTAAGDVDKSGAVDASDASLILAFYAHVQTGGSKTFADFVKENSTPQPVVTTAPAATTKPAAATTAAATSAPATTKAPATTAKPVVSTTKAPAATTKPAASTTAAPVTTTKSAAATSTTTASAATTSTTTTTTTTATTATTTATTTVTTTVTTTTTEPATTTAPVTTEAPAHVSAIRLSDAASAVRLGEGVLAANVEMLPANAADKSEIWSSDNTSVATVDDEGWVTGVSEGECTITVKSADNPDVKADIKIAVVDPKNIKQIVLDRTSMTMEVGSGELSATVKMLPELAYDKREIWSSSDESIAYSDDEGYIIAVAPGQCTITVQSMCNPEVKADILVTVYPKGGTPSDLPDKISEIKLSVTELELKVGERGISYVTMLPDSVENKNEIWKSSDESVAIVDIYGNITALKEGTCTVTVTSEDNPAVSADIAVTVINQNKVSAIKLSKTELVIPLGSYDISYVTMLPETAANQNEIWVSSDDSIASVDEYGNIYARRLGECTVTVYSQDNPAIKAEIRVKTIEVGEKPSEYLGSCIVEEFSGETKVAFETMLPEAGTGRFIIDYIITDADGNNTSVTSSTILLPAMGTVRTTLTAATPEFTVKAYLTNLGNNKNTLIGVYRINMSTLTLTTESEDIKTAFETVEGLTK